MFGMYKWTIMSRPIYFSDPGTMAGTLLSAEFNNKHPASISVTLISPGLLYVTRTYVTVNLTPNAITSIDFSEKISHKINFKYTYEVSSSVNFRYIEKLGTVKLSWSSTCSKRDL